MLSSYRKNLEKAILEKSVSKEWSTAVQEWEPIDIQEDIDKNFSCVCGKTNLRFLYTIINTSTKGKLFPIGSECIKKFERSDLNEYISIKEQLFELLHAVRSKEFIELTSEYFSRKLLEYLYNEGVFISNEYNGFDESNDYKFLLKMFNRRGKSVIGQREERKIRALIGFTIRPWLEEQLGNKIIRKNRGGDSANNFNR